MTQEKIDSNKYLILVVTTEMRDEFIFKNIWYS